MTPLRSPFPIALLTSLLAAACGGSSSPTATPAPSAEPTASATTQPTAQPAETATATATAAASATPDAPKEMTAEEAAAACTTTATWDRKQPGKVTFEVKNNAKHEVELCWLEFYLYDKAGKQLAHESLPYNYKIAPGATDGQPYEFGDLAKKLAAKQVATIETVISRARFSGGGEYNGPQPVPEQRPKAGK